MGSIQKAFIFELVPFFSRLVVCVYDFDLKTAKLSQNFYDYHYLL